MAGLFSKPKKVRAPALPSPPPMPEPELYEEAGEFAKKKTRKRRGKRRTIVTGALEPETTKRTLLG